MKHYTSTAVRWEAAIAFHKIRDPRAVEALIAALDDPVHYVRRTAAGALRKFPTSNRIRSALEKYEKLHKKSVESLNKISRKADGR